MRPHPKVRSAQVVSDTTLVTTAETVAAVIGNVSNQSADGVIRFTGYAAVLGGTNTTLVTARVRRGNGITGTIVGEADPLTLVGAGQLGIPISCEDTPGEVGGVPYSLTIQLTGASANGTVLAASLTAIS